MLAASCSSVAARVAATVVRIPAAAYGEDQMGVRIDEPRDDGRATHVALGVGVRRIGARTRPHDPVILDHECGVSQDRLVAVPCHEFADVGDQQT